MVFVIMAFGGVLGLFWALTLLFATQTKGERSLLIPIIWLGVFVGITGFGGTKWAEANNNPPKLTKSNYLALKAGMSLNDVKNGLDFIDPIDVSGLDEVEREQYDLTSNRIRMPGEVMGRLSPGVYRADRKEARIAVTINGVSSKRGERNNTFRDDDGVKPQLGSSATENEKKRQGHGVQGVKLRFFVTDEEALEQLKEERTALREENAENEDFEMPLLIPPALEGQEWTFEEGQDWTYEKIEDPETNESDFMNAAQVAQKLAEVINEHPYFTAEYEVDEDAMEPSTKFIVFPSDCIEGTAPEGLEKQDDPCEKDGGYSNPYLAKASNDLRLQIVTGYNLAVQVGNSTDGTAQRFIGGADEVELQFWREEEPFLDDDFSTTSRLIVGGFVNGSLFALGQNGLEVTKDEEPIKIEKKE